MTVARQFIAWNSSKINPSRRERCDSIAVEIRKLEPRAIPSAWSRETKSGSSNVYRQNTSRALESYRALRDDSFYTQFQAINCLATIVSP